MLLIDTNWAFAFQADVKREPKAPVRGYATEQTDLSYFNWDREII